jgi:glycosyltransferase involved in cell wall biosynthesis
MQNKKVKILFGVPVKVHKEIAEAEVRAFQKLGYNVEQSYYGNSGQVKGVAGRLFLILRNAIDLKRKLIKQKSDIVYLNTAFDHKTVVRDSISIFILKLLNKKVKIVLKTHGTVKAVVLSKSFLSKYVFKNASLMLVLSTEELDNFKTTFGETTKVIISSNAVDFTDYDPDPNFMSNLKINQGSVVLLFAGRFLEQKGILDLIKACAIVQRQQVCFKLICLGNGPLFEECIQLAKQLNLTESIEFLGHIPEGETKYYYANCDISILPSYREGFPMAVFQAVAAGKAIITTKINAAADHLKEFENCLWTKKNNPEDLSEKIITLAKNKHLRDSMKIKNLALASKFKSINIARNLDSEFKRILVFPN